jgi:hypothetical protein
LGHTRRARCTRPHLRTPAFVAPARMKLGMIEPGYLEDTRLDPAASSPLLLRALRELHHFSA